MVILSVIAHGSPLFWLLVASTFGAVVILVIGVVRAGKRDETQAPAAPVDTPPTPVQMRALQQILNGTGYDYDWQQDVFYSVRNPWQKQFGYCRLYDESAAPLGMVIDCEPVYFEYDGKRWLIELWKGQYGLTAGAEIGVYNTTGPDISIPGVFNGTLYQAAGEDEWLRISFTLFKDKTALFHRGDVHWWLTGFRLGVYTRPASLLLQATITFPASAMRDAFLDSLLKLGYGDRELRVNGNAVLILFSKPHSKQPLTRRGVTARLALYHNKRLVRRYTRLAGQSRNMYVVFTRLKARAPALYQLMMNMGRPRELFRQYDLLRQYRR